MSCRIVVCSCPSRQALQKIFTECFEQAWSHCAFARDIISPENDVGWNFNLIHHLETLTEEFILLMLDDNFLEPGSDYTANIDLALEVMRIFPDIAFVKLQAGGAHAPEIPFAPWPRIREYDRRHHPFKRTNLVPALYRRSWLLRFSRAVLAECGPERDKGRLGALEFESTGTKLTADAAAWPERMMGIHRPNPDGGGGESLLVCYANDAVTGGKLRPFLQHLAVGVEGIEAWL